MIGQSRLSIGDLVKSHLGFIYIIIDIDRDEDLYWCWPVSGFVRQRKTVLRRWNLTLFRKKDECQAD